MIKSDADHGFDEFLEQLENHPEIKAILNDQAIEMMRLVFVAGFDLGCSVTKAKIGITKEQLSQMVYGNFPPQ